MSKIRVISVAVLILFLSACIVTRNDKVRTVESQSAILDVVSAGIPAYEETAVDLKRRGKSLFSVKLSEPVVIDVASKPEKWGYFQFPAITRKLDGNIGARWNMTADAIEAYGENHFGSAISKDGGKTWKPDPAPDPFDVVLLPDGDRVVVVTPKAIKDEDLKLPLPVGTGEETYRKSKFTFYKLHDLPESRQGMFLDRLREGENNWQPEQAKVYDPEAARYSLAGLVPVLWWGDMKVAEDGSLIAGIYPGFIVGKNGVTNPQSGVFFYRSTDGARSWKIQGRIPYDPDLAIDTKGEQRMGFTEPAFEILKDGTFLCVMRSTEGIGNGPMYASYSKDMGKTWTKPDPFTPSGVLPRLLQLDNGVTVLSSGRPGVQLRFSLEGYTWTDPFEMLPFKDEKDQVSCGYTGLLATGRDRFLIIYSDFKYQNVQNELRKSIKVREVTVKPR